MTLWVADVGNTHVHFGMAGRRPRVVPTTRVARLPRVEGECAVASVVPRVERALKRRWPRALFLGRDFPAAISCRARGVGADRLANAAAAWARCRRACVVVDLGTAVTYDVVVGGWFVGGAIAPGMGLSSEALHRRCALLPAVPPGRERRAVAVTTATNIRAGLYFGMRGAIAETLAQIRREIGPARAYGTGSDAPLFADLFDVVPALTLEGIAISYRAWKSAS
jgi:type III pantothenate kinase